MQYSTNLINYNDSERNTILDYSIDIVPLSEEDTIFYWLDIANYSVTGFQINLQRNTLKYLVNYYLPSGLFVVVSWVWKLMQLIHITAVRSVKNQKFNFIFSRLFWTEYSLIVQIGNFFSEINLWSENRIIAKMNRETNLQNKPKNRKSATIWAKKNQPPYMKKIDQLSIFIQYLAHIFKIIFWFMIYVYFKNFINSIECSRYFIKIHCHQTCQIPVLI